MGKHHVILVLGLGEYKNLYTILTKNWKGKYNIIPHVYTVGWKDANENFEQKLQKLDNYITTFISKDSTVSLVGTSAGGSMVLNSYISLKKKSVGINGCIISLCGRFNKDTHWWYPFTHYNKHFPLFVTSIENFQLNQQELTTEGKKRIFTFSALFDEVAPLSTSEITGVNNKRIPFISHLPSIIYMFLAAQELLRVLKMYEE